MNTDRRALVVLSLAFAIVVLDSSALSVAIPAIGHSYASSLVGLQWVTDAYLLAFASFLLASGRLADPFGSRTMLSLGTATFTACSILCAVSPNLDFLVAFRFLQGVAGAILVTSCFSLLAHVFPDGPQRSKAFSVMNMSGSFGACASPVVGGVLIGWLGWRSIFWMNLPVALAVTLGLRGLLNPAAHKHLAFDLAGQFFSVLALGGLAATLIEGGSGGWSNPATFTSGAVCVIAGVAFTMIERQQRDPLMPLALLRIRSFVATSVACGVWRFSFYGLLFFLSVYFQNIRHYSSRLTGLAFLPVVAAPMLTQPFSGRLYQRVGVARTAGGAFVITALGCLLIAVAPDDSYTWVGVGLGLVGVGGGLAMPALGQASLAEIPKQSLGVASGVFNSVGQTGSLIGVAVLGALVSGNDVGSIRVGAVVVMSLFLGGTVVLASTKARSSISRDVVIAGEFTEI